MRAPIKDAQSAPKMSAKRVCMYVYINSCTYVCRYNVNKHNYTKQSISNCMRLCRILINVKGSTGRHLVANQSASS